ncbi:MAG TPA: gephyrin-like molybdotransferase Glp [Methanoregulaceae archaeon]|nr:gephyrin-like molybdotransferase Glp [Methanoregulaceae archaeon]
MSIFLTTVPVEEAIRVVRDISPPPDEELVPLESAYNRILLRDITADIDIPGFTRSVVDGYAVHSADTTGAGEAIPVILRLTGRAAMGASVKQPPLPPGSCIYVPTGGEIPDGADAMAMIEYCEMLGDEVLVKRPLAAGENIIFKGEDFRAGERVLERGRRLSPGDIGVLAATGHSMVPVSAAPNVGIISTGNELVPVNEVPTGSRVRDVNTYLCRSFLEQYGARPIQFGIVRDDPESFETALDNALATCDAVLISGGSSKDDRDLTAGMIQSRGEVFVHGISLAPGKPTIIGQANGKPVIGLPGHPASTFIVLLVIARHMILGMTGNTSDSPVVVRGVLSENIPSARGREEYVRVKITGKGIVPLFGKSGLLNTLVKSNGVIRIPAGSEGIETGTEVEVILW